MSAAEFSDRESVVWVADGRGKDTERYSLLLGIVLFVICFAFVASCTVFLRCAPLLLVTGETVFLSPKWSSRGIQSRKNHLCLRVPMLVVSIR